MHFEKILFLLLSLVLTFVCVILFMQYSFFKVEAQKMILVRQEYHNFIDILKKTIQSKNSDEVTDDLDSLDDAKSEDDQKALEQDVATAVQELDDFVEPNEDILDAIEEVEEPEEEEAY